MTGTSLDGIDLVYCTFSPDGDGIGFEIEVAETVSIAESWKTRIRHLPNQQAEVFAKTHVYFGHYLGEEIAAFIERHGIEPEFVACHGQTIFHQPHRSFTTQIGDGETLASHLSVPLITNFRNKDVALNGEGAPLVPLGEQYLFPDHQLFLNLGGIANLTWKNQAFDVTACNLVLNALYSDFFGGEYDENGEAAAAGLYDEQLAEDLNQLKYYKTPPPKSLGWEWVEKVMIPEILRSDSPAEDLLHTVARHIAFQIARAVRILDISDEKIMVTGGGKHHTFLLDCLAEELAAMNVSIDETVSEDFVDFKEAIIFAFLGHRLLNNQPTTLASVTGASKDVVAGSIHLPPSGGWKLTKV